MPAKSKHPEYDANLPAWSRARDVLAGEDAVKAAGERYLPRLEGQSDAEYAAYKIRASFFGATARTLEEYLDLVFRRAPVLNLGACQQLKNFVADCDLWGSDFLRYARRVVAEVLSVGRAGSLVLWDGMGMRPWVSLFRAEDVLNWAAERAGERAVLLRVALRDGDLVRVFQLEDGVCMEELWGQDEGGLVLSDRRAVKRDGVALSFIPFAFHGPRHSRPEPDRLPLADIIAANLDHYRLDADYKHGLHFTVLPTAWVSGFDKQAALVMGSRSAWVSDVPGATAGFLEFTGAGLAHLERAMEKVERRMALLGAHMLEAANPNPGGEVLGLGSTVASLNQSLSRVLQLAQWWVEGGELDTHAGKVSLAMNTDLGARAMSGDEITAVVAAWRAGAISRETMLERLKRGEVLPDGRSVAQERALIHGKTGGEK